MATAAAPMAATTPQAARFTTSRRFPTASVTAAMTKNAEPRKNVEKTAKVMPKGVPFAPGNPGRPKGSRNRMGEDFIQALQASFHEHGPATIETVRTERPHEYLKVIASLLPKQIEVKEGAFDGVDDETLAALVAAARSALGVADESGAGTKATLQ